LSWGHQQTPDHGHQTQELHAYQACRASKAGHLKRETRGRRREGGHTTASTLGPLSRLAKTREWGRGLAPGLGGLRNLLHKRAFLCPSNLRPPGAPSRRGPLRIQSPGTPRSSTRPGSDSRIASHRPPPSPPLPPRWLLPFRSAGNSWWEPRSDGEGHYPAPQGFWGRAGTPGVPTTPAPLPQRRVHKPASPAAAAPDPAGPTPSQLLLVRGAAFQRNLAVARATRPAFV
jgi:hypothetical protein